MVRQVRSSVLAVTAMAIGLAPRKLGKKSVRDLNGASVCVQSGTTTAENVEEYFRINKMTFKPVLFGSLDELRSGFFAGQHEYSFPKQGNRTSLRISKPGIYFLGSFKYKKVKTGFFQQGKFAIEKVSKPTEAELLKRILDEDDDIRDSAWGAKIRARLAQLKS